MTKGERMTQGNRALPLIAVVDGYSVSSAIAATGAETFDVDTKAEAKLALTYADAIVLTGGGDVNPQRYGQERHKEVYGVDFARDKLEFWLVKKARERGIPILGICRGSQVLNVAHGGTLNQNIYDDGDVTEHWGTNLWVKLAHKSALARSLGTKLLHATHFHHQAVAKVGDGLRAIAWAHDGTIEAVESLPTNPHYVLGVQFHPEMDYKYDQDAMAVFTHFVWDYAAKKASRRKLDAIERLAQAEFARPVKYKYDYASKYRAAGNIVTMDSYLYGTKDDWEYDEWQRLNNQALNDAADELNGLCDEAVCTSPDDCLAWGDCAATAIRQKALLQTEHVQWGSAGYQVEELKRGNPRGGRL